MENTIIMPMSFTSRFCDTFQKMNKSKKERYCHDLSASFLNFKEDSFLIDSMSFLSSTINDYQELCLLEDRENAVGVLGRRQVGASGKLLLISSKTALT